MRVDGIEGDVEGMKPDEGTSHCQCRDGAKKKRSDFKYSGNLPIIRALAQGLQQLTHLTNTLGSVLLHNANGGSGMVGVIQGNMQDQSKRKVEEDAKQVGKKSKFGHLEQVKCFLMNCGTTNMSDRSRQGLSVILYKKFRSLGVVIKENGKDDKMRKVMRCGIPAMLLGTRINVERNKSKERTGPMTYVISDG
nr:hypothetical protein Iba_chr10eCG11890 [Ipomoea batatas]